MVGEKGVDRYVSLCSPLMTVFYRAKNRIKILGVSSGVKAFDPEIYRIGSRAKGGGKLFLSSRRSEYFSHPFYPPFFL